MPAKQILRRSVHKSEKFLPISPRKKPTLIGTFANKFNLRVAACNKSGSKKNELREEKEEWIENLLERPDIAYTTPGRRDTIYIGIDGGKREYKQKRHILWKLRDLLSPMRIFLHSQKLLSMNSHFAECTTP